MTKAITKFGSEENKPSSIYYEEKTAEGTNKKVITAFERISQACDYLEKEKNEIRPASVGRWCENTFAERDDKDNIIKLGSPTKKTINNNRHGYKEYIALRANEVTTARVPAQKRKLQIDESYDYPEEDLSFITKIFINNLRGEIDRLNRELSIYQKRAEELQKDRPVELERLLALASSSVPNDSVPIEQLITDKNTVDIEPRPELLQALNTIVNDFDQTGLLVERYPKATSKPQQTWKNPMTGKPVFPVKQYRILVKLLEQLNSADS